MTDEEKKIAEKKCRGADECRIQEIEEERKSRSMTDE